MSVWGKLFLLIIFISFVISFVIVYFATSIIFVISKIITTFSSSQKKQPVDEKTEESPENFADKETKPKIMLAVESCNNFEPLDKESPQQCSRCQFYQKYSADFKKENMTFGYCRY